MPIVVLTFLGTNGDEVQLIELIGKVKVIVLVTAENYMDLIVTESKIPQTVRGGRFMIIQRTMFLIVGTDSGDPSHYAEVGMQEKGAAESKGSIDVVGVG